MVTYSEDGKWMWTGSEWIPAPPSDNIENRQIINETVNQIAVDTGEIRLQQETLHEIVSITEWTNKFVSKEYKIKEIKIVFGVIAPFYGSLFYLLLNNDGDSTFLWAIILGLLSVLGLYIGIKSLRSQIIFNKEHDKKRYSLGHLSSKSWIKQLDPMITRYEHLINWTSNNPNAEFQRKLMEIEIELTRLIKKRRMSQVLTAAVVGVAAHQVVKSWNKRTD